MNLFEAIIIAIVEGLTEFLPVSSTGHMIIAEKLLGVPDSDFTKLFTVGIQLGAILAVVFLYWKKFVAPLKTGNLGFFLKLIVAVIPALVFGFIFSDKIDAMLESSLTVAITMIAGGIVLLFIDNFFKVQTIGEDEKISYPRALAIGLWQCIAMIPGVSRSAASIIGGMQQQLTRKLAAEFSFFLAVPTMAAATGYKLLKGYNSITPGDLKLFAVGNIVAFIVAMLAIKFFIGYLQKHGFKLFGYYRIVGGLILLALILSGYIK
ncbi:MAG: undecaprenyl-diphosphate phosphatase [Chitinophagaceae bacterium]|nr:undecaprenyl-diphosphate phosphatase [Chitinophagaceae bacterium]MBK8951288.1 undecaprenyl-diphosphate phosphatase [Chitinophagaceae bacterium]